ncbi:hypothetical protein RNT95_10840 [Staphylococcus pseudintermedius]|uniref:hypothetical protein n=1 Tax=Staphylococcus pseudintermedius TaxID=283734 RepID=UPI0025543B78|nr:hypothetical protein [Staphylococcus pseudintermedius]MDK9614862.1 hypothetical protein [Staphylococcus pseudintermedius]MDT0950389.1 hypothetical protein [Staphylococcus pseudintermedius]
MKIRSVYGRITLTDEQVQTMHKNQLKRGHVYNRVLKLGWTVDKAVSTPVRSGK